MGNVDFSVSSLSCRSISPGCKLVPGVKKDYKKNWILSRGLKQTEIHFVHEEYLFYLLLIEEKSVSLTKQILEPLDPFLPHSALRRCKVTGGKGLLI